MTTARQIAANRRNARRSTGPKTTAGKKQSSRNAKRLGLSLPVVADARALPEISALTKEIAGENAQGMIGQLARDVAVAEVDLLRIRQARDAVWKNISGYCAPAQSHEKNETAAGDFGQPSAVDAISTTADPCSSASNLLTRRRPPSEIAAALSEAVHQLHSISRYHRRALSRRKFATRRLDQALLSRRKKTAESENGGSV